jgi:hypothetical protein
MILKPAVIIVIIFSITIVLAGIGIVEMGSKTETLPVETLPVETLPVETLPVETLPVETLPVETLPVETLPVETLPVETTQQMVVSSSYEELSDARAKAVAEAKTYLESRNNPDNLVMSIPYGCDPDWDPWANQYLNANEQKFKDNRMELEKNMSDGEKCKYRGPYDYWK